MLTLGAYNFIQVSHRVEEIQTLGPLFAAFLGELTGSSIRNRSAGTWTGVYIGSSDLIGYITALISLFLFCLYIAFLIFFTSLVL